MTVQPHVTILLTQAAKEYSWTIPAGALGFSFVNSEGDTDIQYYWKSNASGGGPGKDGNYKTLPQGNERFIQGPWNISQTIYFQAVSNANRNVVIEYATNP